MEGPLLNLIKFILKRIAESVLLLLAITLIIFIAMKLTPNDAAVMLSGPEATEADIESMRNYLGLNDPLHEQYFNYMENLLKGDLGTSYTTKQNVGDEILARLPNTINLAVAAMIFAMLVGIPFGVLTSMKQNSFLDQTLTTASLVGISVPNFWLGSMLILVFSVLLGWLPTGGMTEPFWTPLGFKQAILPAIALGLATAAQFTRIGRASMLDVLQSDYIRTADAKGLRNRRIYFIHAFRNALIPLLTVFGTSFGGLLGGAIVTEKVFVINGLGTYLIDAISRRNDPAVQSTVLVIAMMYVVVNLVIDILYVFVDPRISYEGKS